MTEKRYFMVLNDFERRVVINGLNQFRTLLLSEGKTTDALDEAMRKLLMPSRRDFGESGRIITEILLELFRCLKIVNSGTSADDSLVIYTRYLLFRKI